MITEDYVSFEIAKLLKEKGFEGDTSCYFVSNTSKRWTYQHYHDFDKKDRIECPTLQMAMKWLREVHKLCLFIIPATIDDTFIAGYALYPQCDSKWEWCASKNDRSKATFGCNINKDYCDSYEEACEAAIKYCLENLI